MQAGFASDLDGDGTTELAVGALVDDDGDDYGLREGRIVRRNRRRSRSPILLCVLIDSVGSLPVPWSNTQNKEDPT